MHGTDIIQRNISVLPLDLVQEGQQSKCWVLITSGAIGNVLRVTRSVKVGWDENMGNVLNSSRSLWSEDTAGIG